MPSTAQNMGLARAIRRINLCPNQHPIPQPAQQKTQRYEICFPNQHNTTRKGTKTNTATRTSATSEDRDSDIRQRCGCKPHSSNAESCSAPSSRRHVEDVYSVGGAAAVCSARHKNCTHNQQTNLRPLNNHIPQRAQHNTQRYKNKHGNTYRRHQRRSRLRYLAAMWLQEILDLR